MFTGQWVIGGLILSLIIGIYLLVSGLGNTYKNGENPGLFRFLSLVFGLMFVFTGIGLLFWAFNGASNPGWREMRPVISWEGLLIMASLGLIGLLARGLELLLVRSLQYRLRRKTPIGKI